MTENEFVEKMKELGWKNEDIEEYVKMHKMKLDDGIYIPLEVYLRPYPQISRYPSEEDIY